MLVNLEKVLKAYLNGNKCIFVAPPEELVPKLIQDLFDWMKRNKKEVHPLILSSVFHYELLFIHPFSDGNGRMARLWQNVILSKWKEIFKFVPIESQIKKYQDDYYKAIANCNKNGNSNEFIEFMLKVINETLSELIKTASSQSNYISKYVEKLLMVMDENIPLTSSEIMERLNLKSKETLRKNYINPAIEAGLIKLTIPDKPRSKNQMYFKES